LDAKGLLTKRP